MEAGVMYLICSCGRKPKFQKVRIAPILGVAIRDFPELFMVVQFNAVATWMQNVSVHVSDLGNFVQFDYERAVRLTRPLWG